MRRSRLRSAPGVDARTSCAQFCAADVGDEQVACLFHTCGFFQAFFFASLVNLGLGQFKRRGKKKVTLVTLWALWC